MIDGEGKKIKLFEYVFGWILSKSNYKYSRPIIRAYSLSFVFAFFPGFGRHRKNNSWIIGSKIFTSDENLKNYTLISTPKDFKRLRKLPRYIGQFYSIYFLIYMAFLFKRTMPLNIAWKLIETSIKKHTPPLLFINSTKDPFNRLIAAVARTNNIKIICIQHGFFKNTIPDEINEDDIVDEYCAINDNQRKIVARKIPIEKIKLLSEASIIFNTSSESAIKRICLVGEDWERYGEYAIKKKIINFYIDLVNKLSASDLGNLEISYRPHPSEKEYFDIGKFINISKLSPDRFDLFIGFSSTFLWDMSVQSKYCLQIYSELITDIDFEMEKICPSIQFDNAAADKVIDFIKNPSAKYKINLYNISDMLKI